jgi:hypothetical protein
VKRCELGETACVELSAHKPRVWPPSNASYSVSLWLCIDRFGYLTHATPPPASSTPPTPTPPTPTPTATPTPKPTTVASFFSSLFSSSKDTAAASDKEKKAPPTPVLSTEQPLRLLSVLCEEAPRIVLNAAATSSASSAASAAAAAAASASSTAAGGTPALGMDLYLQSSQLTFQPSPALGPVTFAHRFQTARWYHVVLVHSRARLVGGSELRLFVDGVCVERKSVPFPKNEVSRPVKAYLGTAPNYGVSRSLLCFYFFFFFIFF